MDQTADKSALENEMRAIESYLDHPITRKVLTDSQESQEVLINVICEIPIHDIESFFKHFEAVGHLRGLRRSKEMMTEGLEEIKQKLKELQ